ncbi:hypothetical protein LIER_09325 [Lithospermum erythrorhizon]|uniref:Uncharacterized protein n=1 Tax=Lithospermum erythrorhizon TaxID=34254 RepID=A0AAV3PFC7_LITER
MGTQVLRPQDCLVERFPVLHGQRNYSPTKGNGFGYTKTNHIINNNTNYVNKKSTTVQTGHKKRYHNQSQQYQQQNCSTSPKKISSLDESKSVSRHRNTRNDLEMGQVTVVRRGDSLDSLNSRIKKDMTKKSAFDPAEIYAGSAFSVSPSPSSLPLPTFFKKQELKPFDDSATRDLRRLLRLE